MVTAIFIAHFGRVRVVQVYREKMLSKCFVKQRWRNMLHKVDYISFTFYNKTLDGCSSHRAQEIGISALPEHITHPNMWKPAPHRQGFDFGYNIDNHTFVFFNRTGLILIEHTGAGCDLLQERGILLDVLKRYQSRLSRLDVATDILSDVRPRAFADRRGASSIKSGGFQSSKSGETCYVGSKSSDRTCKVYRYDGKHPRAAFLRIEYTYRREQAKLVGKLIVDEGIEKTALRSAARYRWQHIEWKRAKTPKMDEIKAYRPERRHGKTVAWVWSQCIPAIVKLIKLGALDQEEIINEIRKGAQTQNSDEDNASE